MDTVNNFQSIIDTIIPDYKPQDIFNCDITNLPVIWWSNQKRWMTKNHS